MPSTASAATIEASVLDAGHRRGRGASATALSHLRRGRDWHAGVIGIVAGRLKERYQRPACVIALSRTASARAPAARWVPCISATPSSPRASRHPRQGRRPRHGRGLRSGAKTACPICRPFFQARFDRATWQGGRSCPCSTSTPPCSPAPPPPNSSTRWNAWAVWRRQCRTALRAAECPRRLRRCRGWGASADCSIEGADGMRDRKPSPSARPRTNSAASSAPLAANASTSPGTCASTPGKGATTSQMVVEDAALAG